MQQSFKNHFIKNAPRYYFRLFIIAAQFFFYPFICFSH